MDFSLPAQVAPAVHHVAHAAHHVAAVAPVIKTVLVGVTYKMAAIYSVISLAAGFGLGWYIKGRGMAGVQIDLNNVKTDVENLKDKVFPVATPVPTPVV